MKEQASQGLPPSGADVTYTGKKSLQFSKPTIEKIGEEYFLVAHEVYNLSASPVKRMTEMELMGLPVILSWKGPPLRFETDRASCLRLLLDIIYNMNIMQDTEYVSLPVGN